MGAIVLLFAGTVSAQTTAVCSNTPGDNQRVSCVEGSDSTADIDISLEDGVSISTDGDVHHGVSATHDGVGDVTISIKGKTGRKTISTSGPRSYGVQGRALGKGSADVTVQNVDLTLTGTGEFYGIYGAAAFSYPGHDPYTGEYNARVTVSDSSISMESATGTNSGISGLLWGSRIHALNGKLEMNVTDTDISMGDNARTGIEASVERTSGDATVNVTGGTIAMPGASSYGILLGFGDTAGSSLDSGDATLNVTDATINMTDVRDDNERAQNLAIYVLNFAKSSDNDIEATLTNTTLTGGRGIQAWRNLGSGNVTVRVDESSITTNGTLGYSVYGAHSDTGDIVIDARDTTIETQGTTLWPTAGGNFSHGIHGLHLGNGNVDIDARGGSIRTAGASASGIVGDQRGSPAGSHASVDIATHDGHEIATTGIAGHGIVAYHRGMGESRAIAVTVGGSITASGADAEGVRVGNVDTDDAVSLAGTFDDQGYRRHTATVTGAVTGNAAGIFLAGGGRVVIGPTGTVGATSGVAILASGGDSPKLLVDIDLAGRRIADVLGDGWIVNDGGETTIIVNGTKLHDGVNGATDAVAVNGPFKVTMRKDGLTVTNRDTPGSWTFSERSTTTVADRDFSADDFSEGSVPVVAAEIPDQTATVGHVFNYELPPAPRRR